jgi:hypothetical protein
VKVFLIGDGVTCAVAGQTAPVAPSVLTAMLPHRSQEHRP